MSQECLLIRNNMETLQYLLLQQRCSSSTSRQENQCKSAQEECNNARIQCNEELEINFEKLVLRCRTTRINESQAASSSLL